MNNNEVPAHIIWDDTRGWVDVNTNEEVHHFG